MGQNDGKYASAELASALREEPGEHIKPWAGLVDDPEQMRLLNRLDRTLDRPVEESEVGREIIGKAATETVDDAVRGGRVAQMKAATGMSHQSESTDRFYTEVAHRLSHEGAVGLVFGSPGAGKTSVCIDSAAVWRALTGGTVIANVRWDGADGYFESDTEMLELMAEQQGQVLAVIDEVAQELSGFGSGNKKVEAFSDSLLFIRKREEKHGPYPKQGSVLSVAHTRTKTAKEIRRVASFAVEKPDKSRKQFARLLDSVGGKDEWQELGTFTGLTDSAESFDEYQASSFEVSEYDDDSDDSDGGLDPARRADIQTALTVALVQGESYDTAGDAVGYSSSWVSDRVAEYREGEYDWLDLDTDE